MSIIDPAIVEDHERFRAELASIHPDGRRKWIFARKPPAGLFYRLRTYVSWVLLVFLFGAPFVKIDGHQFILLDVINRHFVLFGLPFWPNDFYLVALLFLSLVVTIVLFTATIGRVWCGWLCPQTIFMEMVFRKIEWLIDGGPREQAQRKAGPWNYGRLWRTTVKVIVFALISFAIANTFLAYIVSSDVLIRYMIDGPGAHLELFVSLVAFTFVFFMVFYRFREQACLIACPYGRYMSALVDENTIAVTYDSVRGDPRAKWTKDDTQAKKVSLEGPQKYERAHGVGDCVDCHQCVTVCPTGIDIRNGIQLECVNCTACIDACDEVMDKVGMRRGLIRYTSLRAIHHGTTAWMTPRIKAYGAIWILLVTTVVGLFALRSNMDVMVLRQEGTTWVEMDDRIGNFYRLQLINKTNTDLPVEIKVVSPRQAQLTPIDLPTRVESQHIAKGRFLISLPAKQMRASSQDVVLRVRWGSDETTTITTSLIGP